MLLEGTAIAWNGAVEDISLLTLLFDDLLARLQSLKMPAASAGTGEETCL